MGLRRSLAMLLLFIWFFWLPHGGAQLSASSINNARALNALLQDYAFKAFGRRPKTGIPYNGTAPSNLTGIEIAAMRLRSGSLRRKGVQMFKEFQIPEGVIGSPYVERLVLVYQNLGNWSTVYYQLTGYTYLAPVLGLLAYNASNLLATNLPELNIKASDQPISIVFPDVNSVSDGSVAKCVWFDLHGLVNFSDVVSGNTCSTLEQGHFTIAIKSTVPPPAPAPSGGGKKKKKSKVWIIVGSVLGGLMLLVLLGFLALWVEKYKRRRKMQHMEKAAEFGEELRMTSVGSTKAPAAMVTRTQPLLETEYVP